MFKKNLHFEGLKELMSYGNITPCDITQVQFKKLLMTLLLLFFFV